MNLPRLDLADVVRTVSTVAITAAVVAVVIVGRYERGMRRECFDRGYCVTPAEVLRVRKLTGSNEETIRRLDPRMTDAPSRLARR